MATASLRRVIVLVASGLVGLAIALLAASLGELLRAPTYTLLVISGVPGLLAAVAAALALRLGRTRQRATAMFVGFFAGCCILAPIPLLALLDHGLFEGEAGDLPGTMIMAGMSSLILVSPFAMPVAAAARRLEHPSRDTLDSAIQSCCWWAAGAMACSYLVVDLPAACSQPALFGPPRLIVVVPFALFVTAAALARLHLGRRRQWLERVARGEVPEFTVMPAAEFRGALGGVPPLFHGPERPLDGVVLRRTRDVGPGAYRSAERSEPWALVDLEELSSETTTSAGSTPVAGGP